MKNKILKIINLVLLWSLFIIVILTVFILAFELISTFLFVGALFGYNSLASLFVYIGLIQIIPLIFGFIILFFAKKEYKRTNYITSILIIFFPIILGSVFLYFLNISNSNNNILKFISSSNSSVENKDKEKSDMTIRDNERLILLTKSKSKIRKYYLKNKSFPETLKEIGGLPRDKKDGEIINGCKFGYTYEVFENKKGIEKSGFRLSTCLEIEKNIKNHAKIDGGIYDDKFEVFYDK